MSKQIDSACPFCDRTIQRATFAETTRFLAVCNSAPILHGHCLVLPRHHVQTILELDNNELMQMMLFSKKVTMGLLNILNATGFDWTLQQGEEAGQTVPHLHLHVIPRKIGDLPDPGDWYPELQNSVPGNIDSYSRPQLADEELERLAKELRSAFANGGWLL
jgi:bis(5'-adenosyl)-triphosphatase